MARLLIAPDTPGKGGIERVVVEINVGGGRCILAGRWLLPVEIPIEVISQLLGSGSLDHRLTDGLGFPGDGNRPRAHGAEESVEFVLEAPLFG
ncbi:hypothetical protein, partial [Mesorhizobium sp.]|uniref:hypothetical protein n=1 Tax=Mesorhizobium sp. TaxID=1871066 RepID=UPI0025C70BDD